VVWLRITGLALLIAGALSLLLLPTSGRIGLVSVALIIVGAVTLSVAKRDRRSRDGLSGGVYGDSSGPNTDYPGHDQHGGHEGGHGSDGGHGGDGGFGGDGGDGGSH
jgi:hypothetical protein